MMIKRNFGNRNEHTTASSVKRVNGFFQDKLSHMLIIEGTGSHFEVCPPKKGAFTYTACL